MIKLKIPKDKSSPGIPEPSKDQKDYLLHIKRRKHRILFFQCFLFLLFIFSWEFFTWSGSINPFIFSSPSRIFTTFITMAGDGSIFYHTGVTLMETFLSFLLVNILGLLFAVLLWWNEMAAKISDPYLVVLNSLPKTALAPVFIVWLGNNMKTIIVAAVSVAVFGTTITLYHHFQETEPDKIKLVRTFGGTKKDILKKVILPSSLPALLSLMKVNIGLSLVGVIIGEFLAAKAGLGYLIIYGEQVFKLDYVLLSIVILCVVATGLYALLSVAERKLQHF